MHNNYWPANEIEIEDSDENRDRKSREQTSAED
jgi:hypothetical protein